MERQKLQKDMFGNMKVLNKTAHNKYFNYYVYKNALLHGLEPGILRSLHNGNDTII